MRKPYQIDRQTKPISYTRTTKSRQSFSVCSYQDQLIYMAVFNQKVPFWCCFRVGWNTAKKSIRILQCNIQVQCWNNKNR